jgi:hypothetical protein
VSVEVVTIEELRVRRQHVAYEAAEADRSGDKARVDELEREFIDIEDRIVAEQRREIRAQLADAERVRREQEAAEAAEAQRVRRVERRLVKLDAEHATLEAELYARVLECVAAARKLVSVRDQSEIACGEIGRVYGSHYQSRLTNVGRQVSGAFAHVWPETRLFVWIDGGGIVAQHDREAE